MTSIFKIKGKYRVVGSMFISLLLSLLITSILISISSLSDSICISRFLGENAIASYSLVKPIFKFFGIFTSIVTSGLQIVLGTELGKGNTKNANKLFTFFFILCLLIGIVILVLGLTIPNQLAFLFGATDMSSELNNMAADFLKGVLIGAPFLLIYSALLPIYSYIGARKLIIGCAFVNSLVDILFNILNGKFFNLGMFGMGLSTTFGYVLAVIPMVLYIVIKKSGLHFDFSEFTFKKKGSVFLFGLPKAFKSLSTSLKSVIINSLILTIGGSIALTASGVEESLFGILNVLTSSLPGVFISLMCLYKIDKDKESCYHLLKIIFIYTVTIVLGCTILVICLAPIILPVFNLQTPESINTSLLSVRIGLIAVPLTIFNGLYLAYLQITKRIRKSNIFNVLFYFVSPVVVTLILGFTLKTIGLWIAIPACEVVNSIIIWITGCIKHRKIVTPVAAAFEIENDFGDSSVYQYHFEVQKKSDLDFHFPKIINILIEKGFKDEIIKKVDYTYKAFLDANIVDENKKIKKINTDILVSIKDGHVSIRLRNDNQGMNVVQRAELVKKRREASKKDPSIIVLEDCLDKIDIVDILNIHNAVFTISWE